MGAKILKRKILEVKWIPLIISGLILKWIVIVFMIDVLGRIAVLFFAVVFLIFAIVDLSINDIDDDTTTESLFLTQLPKWIALILKWIAILIIGYLLTFFPSC